MIGELVEAVRELPDIEFANPWAGWLLLMLPLVIVLEFWPQRARRGPMSFTGTSNLGGLGRGWRVYAMPIPPLCKLLAALAMIVAVARPQLSDAEEMRVEGIDIYVALDMSGSMQAVDMTMGEVEGLRANGATPPNRFDNATDVLRSFVESRRERCNRPPEGAVARCDRIGMVVFGREAFLEFPLTLDYGTILGLLDQRELNDIDGSGTAIGNAVARAVAGLRPPEDEADGDRVRSDDGRERVVVLITDGDRRGGHVSPAQAASMASHFGIKVFPILVGREGPTLLPSNDQFSLQQSYQVVEFPVNPTLLRTMANMTEGEFYRATDKESLEADLHAILDQFDRTEMEGSIDVSTTERFQPFAMAAVVLLLAGLLVEFVVIRKFP